MSAPPGPVHWLNFLTAAGPVALDVLVKSVLLLALAGLVTGGMRRCSAAARHLVWLLAVTGLFALPVLSWTLPGWDILPRWMEVRRSVPAVDLPRKTPDKPLDGVQERLPGDRTDRSDPTDKTDGTKSPTPLAASTVNPLLISPVRAPVLSARFNGRELGAAAWLAGFAFVFFRTLAGVAVLWRLELGSHPETSPLWLNLLRRLAARLGLRRPVVLLKSRRRQMPMTWGVMRPKLLLPEAAEEWPEERRRAVLLHELAHARRWDYATNLVTRLACAVWWFNPLVWLAARQMAAERERACDDIVLNHGAKPAEYAAQILGIAAGLRRGGWTECVGIAMARPSKLEGRLRAILDNTRQRTAPARSVILLMLAVSLLVVVPVAMLHAAPEAVPPRQSARQETNRPGFLTIRGNVVDAETHQPIPEFTVTRGLTPGDPDLLNWLTGQSQPGQHGYFNIELGDPRPFYAIMAQAPGYLPEMLFLGHPTNGMKTTVIELHKGEGFSGTVVGLDGHPVKEAQVAYIVRWGGLQLDGHKIVNGGSSTEETQYKWQHTPVSRTDAQGHFSLPGMPGITSLIVFHENGFAQIPRETLDRTRVIRLQPWANTAPAANDKGFKVRLKVNKTVWPAGAAPQLTAEIRNEGGAKLLSSSDRRLWRIEADGKWYRLYIQEGPMSEIKADGTWTNGMVTLDRQWYGVGEEYFDATGEAMYGQLDAWYSMGHTEPLTLVPGKHVIRLAVFAVEAAAETTGTIEAVSDPVEIEMAVPSAPADEVKPATDENRRFGPVTNSPLHAYSTEASMVSRLSQALFSVLDKKFQKEIDPANPIVQVREMTAPVTTTITTKFGTKYGFVYVSTGYVDFLNHLAHARAIDLIQPGYFEQYMLNPAQASGSNAVPDLPNMNDDRYWTTEVMDSQASYFNQMMGMSLALNFAHRYLGRFDQYRDRMQAGNQQSFVHLLTPADWDANVKAASLNCLNSALSLDGARALFKAIEQMPNRPAWAADLVPPGTDLNKLIKQLSDYEARFFHGQLK